MIVVGRENTKLATFDGVDSAPRVGDYVQFGTEDIQRQWRVKGISWWFRENPECCIADPRPTLVTIAITVA
jgi:hypothetical protein